MICDYIYTEEGLRAQSGSVVVKLSWPDGTIKTLSVVRSGKGRSRIDRWEANPRPDGVTGEINTRDLQDWMEQNGVGEIDGVISTDGVSLEVSLERDSLMGRSGREHTGFREYLESLGEREQKASALLMLKNMPYGLENTEDFKERTDASLEVLGDDDIKALLEGGNFNFLGHCSDAELAKIVKPYFGIISSLDGVDPEIVSRVEHAVMMSTALETLGRLGDRALRKMMQTEAFSTSDLVILAGAGSEAAAVELSKIAPEEALRAVTDPSTPASARLMLIFKLTVGQVVVGAEHVQSALSEVELAEFLRTSSRVWDKSDSIASDVTRAAFARVLFEAGGLPCSSEIKRACLQGDSVTDWYSMQVGRAGPVTEEAVRWASQLPVGEAETMTREQLADVSEILLRNGHSSERTFPPVYTDFIGDASASLRPSPIEHILHFTRRLDYEGCEDILKNQESDAREDFKIDVAGEMVLALSNAAIGERLTRSMSQTALETAERFEGDTSYMHRPAYGVIEARKGPEEAAAWLENLSSIALADSVTNDVFEPIRRSIAELSANDAELSSLAVSVAIGLTTASSDALERDLLRKTASAARVRGVDRVRDRVDKKDLSIVTYDSWAEPYGFSVTGEESRQVIVAAAMRAGIALGTDNLDTLLEMANNEREFSAGPIAALRIIGHPSLKPLKKRPSDSQIDRARELLDRHHDLASSRPSSESRLKPEINNMVVFYTSMMSAFKAAA